MARDRDDANPSLFHAVFEGALDAMLLVDDEGRYIDANPAACALLGVERETLQAMHVTDLLPGMVDFDAAWRAFLAAGRDESEITLRRPDGTTIETESRATANVAPGVHLAIHRDLTNRRRAESALADTRSWASEILESLDDGYIALDHQWRFAYLNPAAEGLFQRPREQLLGKVIWEEFPESVGLEFERRYRHVMSTREPVTFEAYFPPPFDTWYREQVRPAADGIAVLSRDVGEQRRLEQRVHQDDKLRAIGELAGGIAHDFNNVLTAVSGFAELAQELVNDGRDPTEPITEIDHVAEHGAGLVAELLAFSRRQACHPEPLSPAEVVDGAQGLLERLLSEAIELRIDVAPDLPTVHADRGQLQQVLVNLAVNAQDAMPRGGVLTIRARAGPDEGIEDGWVELAVADTGTGMDAETRERMFEPFFTTKPAGQGSGLGLPSVHSAVTAAGGYLVVDSTRGAGTTIRVRLPAASPPRASEQEDDDAEAAPGAAPPPGRATILLVEDEATVRSLVATALERAGHRVLTASDGREAITLADSHHDPIELLVTDVVLPSMSGPRIAEDLRGRWPTLPVLLMSGYTAAQLTDTDLSAEHTDLLPKPFGLSDLLAAVNRLLAG